MPSVLAPPESPSVFRSPKETGVSFPTLLKKHLPLKDHLNSKPVVGSTEEGFSPVFRNAAVEHVKSTFIPELNTHESIWRNAAANFASRPALASRPYDHSTSTSAPYYVSETFAEVDEKKRNLGAGILHLLQNSPFKNSQLESHRKIDSHYDIHSSFDSDNISFVVTLYSANRAEWMITDLACSAYSLTNTVLYDTLGPKATEYILELVQSPIVVASYCHVDRLVSLKRQNPDMLAALICIVSMEPLNCNSDLEGATLRKSARDCNIELYDMHQVMGVGKLFPCRELPPSPKMVYTISFTSGTTGSAPKGVVLTHEVAAAGIAFTMANCPYIENDVELAFLPLAHIFERQSAAYTLSVGGLVGFPQINGSPLTLLEDIRCLKPKHMSNVPRVYTKLEAAIKHATLHSDSTLKRALFSRILGTKMGLEAPDGVKTGHFIYDKLVINKVRKLMGFENMRYCVTGSAPIAPSTIRFMKAALDMGFAQGYGLTESFAGMSFSSPYEASSSSCGAPAITCDIRVRELPDMGYRLDDPRGFMGELQLRGPQIFDRYYKNEDETKKVMKDGWFSTGDVARIDRGTGRLFIVDRVKNFFKLSQGEYVTPEKVENCYLSSIPLLTQMFAYGNSTQSFMVAVIGVDKERVTQFLKTYCNSPLTALSSEEEILKELNKKENRKALVHHMNSIVKDLNGFEKIKNVHVEFEPLTLERDVITPTVKLKRPIAAKFFEAQIEQMYEEAELWGNSKL